VFFGGGDRHGETNGTTTPNPAKNESEQPRVETPKTSVATTPSMTDTAQVPPPRLVVSTPPIKPITPTQEISTATERALFQYDSRTQKPFSIKTVTEADPNDATKKISRTLAQTNADEAPADWKARPWGKDAEMEFSAEKFGEKMTLAFRNLKGPASAMVFSPTIECPTGLCRLKIEYQTAVRDKKFLVKFKPNDQRLAWELATLSSTGPTWRTEEVVADLKGATGGYFEFHNNDAAANAPIRISRILVTELKPANPLEERVAFRLDAAVLPDFKFTKQGTDTVSGDKIERIKGVTFSAYKKETLNDWTCGPVAGAKAIGLTNISETKSTQIAIELEKADGLALKFEPGQILKLRVVYRTAGKGRGSMSFQTNDYKNFGSTSLGSSNTEWRTAELVAVRPDKPTRCIIDATEPGEGNTLFIRSITLIDLGKNTPSPTPAPERPVAPERQRIYNLDMSVIKPFLIQREHGMRISGDPERLPPGITCHCWKDKTVAEFQWGQVEDVPALMLRNVNQEISCQYVFSLEKGMKLALKPSQAYRVTVNYLTQNEATGGLIIQTVPGYRSMVSVPLPSTGNKWKEASITFVRPPVEDSSEMRFVIENKSAGEDKNLAIRSVEVFEVPATK
jgi:hypothetical protein